MRQPKNVKVKVYFDSDFPEYVFLRYGQEVRVFKEINKVHWKDRNTYQFSLHKKGTNPRLRAIISEQRIAAAMELERDVLDVRYISRNRCFRVKKNAILLGLIKAKAELTAEHPGLPINDYIDDAYVKIINSGYIPTDYDDIKEVILRAILSVKTEREHRLVSLDKVDYRLKAEEDEE